MCALLSRYLYTRKTESGGRCFPLIFQKMLGCLAIMAFCTSAALFGKNMSYAACFAFFPLGIVIWAASW